MSLLLDIAKALNRRYSFSGNFPNEADKKYCIYKIREDAEYVELPLKTFINSGRNSISCLHQEVEDSDDLIFRSMCVLPKTGLSILRVAINGYYNTVRPVYEAGSTYDNRKLFGYAGYHYLLDKDKKLIVEFTAKYRKSDKSLCAVVCRINSKYLAEHVNTLTTFIKGSFIKNHIGAQIPGMSIPLEFIIKEFDSPIKDIRKPLECTEGLKEHDAEISRIVSTYTESIISDVFAMTPQDD